MKTINHSKTQMEQLVQTYCRSPSINQIRACCSNTINQSYKETIALLSLIKPSME